MTDVLIADPATGETLFVLPLEMVECLIHPLVKDCPKCGRDHSVWAPKQ